CRAVEGEHPRGRFRAERKPGSLWMEGDVVLLLWRTPGRARLSELRRGYCARTIQGQGVQPVAMLASQANQRPRLVGAESHQRYIRAGHSPVAAAVRPERDWGADRPALVRGQTHDAGALGRMV